MTAESKGQIILVLNAYAASWLLVKAIIAGEHPLFLILVFGTLGITFVLGRKFARQEVGI